jgi:hypothetical protein
MLLHTPYKKGISYKQGGIMVGRERLELPTSSV